MKVRVPMNAATKHINSIIVVEAPVQAAIEEYAWKLRDLLCTYKVPTERWNDLWFYIGTEETNPAFSELDEDLDVALAVGFFRGLSAVLNAKPWELVKL
jgi:hypothetical protein